MFRCCLSSCTVRSTDRPTALGRSRAKLPAQPGCPNPRSPACTSLNTIESLEAKMDTFRRAGRIAAATICALSVLAAPALAARGRGGGGGGGGHGGMHGGGIRGGGTVHGGGSTPLPGSAGSKPMEELNQPNFQMDAPTSRFAVKPGVTPHLPRLAPPAPGGATGQ